MSILKDLNELVGANIIQEETAQKITAYYKSKQAIAPNKQLLIFGVLGALLIGTGLMFIIANQWDDLSQPVKTACAFLLLAIPQFLGAFVLLKKEGNKVWQESVALLLFFAVGANISLISQIYHINGEASSFFLTWMLLTLPLIYLMDSSAVSLAYYIGIMSYCFAAKQGATEPFELYLFWFLFLLPLPRYIKQFKTQGNGPLFALHHWIIPFVLTLTLFTPAQNFKELLSLAYILLFGLFYLIGNLSCFTGKSSGVNGYRVFGLVGTMITLLIMSFQFNWKIVSEQTYHFDKLLVSPEFIAVVILFLSAATLFYLQNSKKSLGKWKLHEGTFLIFSLLFLIGIFSSQIYVLVNLFVLVSAVMLIRNGTIQKHLGILNSGMVLVALLAVCRSLDTNLTFVLKGGMFVLVGIGFFVANWLMLKKRKDNEA